VTDDDLDRTRRAMRDAGIAIRDKNPREALLHLRLAQTLVELWAATELHGPLSVRGGSGGT
jgi:hypothetical protein